jgi:hypothetical protein
MRCAGKPYHEIAKAIGRSSPSAAYKAVRRALDRVEADIAQGAIKLRAQQSARIDELLIAIWEKAIGVRDELGNRVTQPDLRAVDRVIKLLERRAKLLGLDVDKLEVSGAGGGPIDIKSEREQVAGLIDRIAAGVEALKTDGDSER